MKYLPYIKNIAIFMILLVISIPFVFAEEYSRTYDANGNLVSDGQYYREYDGLNQLVRVRLGNTSSSPILEEYRWHPIDERIIQKKVYYNGVYNYTVYYPNENFVQIVNSSGTFTEKYVYQARVLVAQINTDGQKQAIHNDHEGTNTLITNASGGIIENTFYSPYGEIISGGKASRYGYEGKEYDALTDDIDFKFRKYEADIPILDKADTVIDNVYDPQQLNRYMFERGNPYRYVDEDGHIFWAPIIAAVVSVVVVTVIAAVIGYVGGYVTGAVGSIASQAISNIKDGKKTDDKSQGKSESSSGSKTTSTSKVKDKPRKSKSRSRDIDFKQAHETGKEVAKAGAITLGLHGFVSSISFNVGAFRSAPTATTEADDVVSSIKINKGQATVTYKNLFPKGTPGDYHETILGNTDRYGNTYASNIHGTIQRGGDLKNIKVYSNDLASDESFEAFLNSQGK